MEKRERRVKRFDCLRTGRRKVFFFELSYWKCLKLRHNLDVMYIEKNVCDNIIGTLMNIKGSHRKINYSSCSQFSHHRFCHCLGNLYEKLLLNIWIDLLVMKITSLDISFNLLFQIRYFSSSNQTETENDVWTYEVDERWGFPEFWKGLNGEAIVQFIFKP